jgi:hypothetical protein
MTDRVVPTVAGPGRRNGPDRAAAPRRGGPEAAAIPRIVPSAMAATASQGVPRAMTARRGAIVHGAPNR